MCSICKNNPCSNRCPNARELKPLFYCSYCGGGILHGEEYIENDDGDKRHYDCIFGLRELLSWLNCEIFTVEGEEYE